ncbi:hypothetical protein PoB_005722400 [Plakobranchus ocellatus]|uniref:Uncharacterized protein n=1 Tax=Plakobranchus ocellatus TaxID=259542 RepID=A0AAV4CIR5_9GAST|nr:hypothetical protein PoB_005722400 [Plakobranchus ocellatus]
MPGFSRPLASPTFSKISTQVASGKHNTFSSPNRYFVLRLTTTFSLLATLCYGSQCLTLPDQSIAHHTFLTAYFTSLDWITDIPRPLWVSQLRAAHNNSGSFPLANEMIRLLIQSILELVAEFLVVPTRGAVAITGPHAFFAGVLEYVHSRAI